MHGQSCEEENRERQRMRPVVPYKRPAAAGTGTIFDNKCFSKNGRKINVGDCALFQAGNTPPFIGIIRDLATDKEGNLKVVVNWLYRPADVSLVKGVPVEAAPNEVFYSFHRDEISGVSLLHPCKVAFLRKGIELPPGVSSFVCRRVYDIATKRLWWLTDRDYADDHQEEVDQLLDRKNNEMQASGVPSPGSHAGSTLFNQPKMNSEAVQHVSTKGKGRKRERIDHSSDSSKRERLLKMDDSDLSNLKREPFMKPLDEIASITDKDGGLLNLESVDQLVHLMQQDCSDSCRKSCGIVSRRTMFSGIIASTEKEECLNRFVQLGGLPMLNDWLQEAHKGKDGESLKEGDKGCEELLMTLLQALEGLPIDLDALKKCIVGKSVNNLRSHKNFEIQKRARKLVEMWKKRVDAEMKRSGELKVVSNPMSKPSSVDQMRLGAGSETISNTTKASGSNCQTKCASDSMCSVKSLGATPGIKDRNLKPHASALSEVSFGAFKEEKSSSPIHSQNNSQSLSSGSSKGAFVIAKEEVKISYSTTSVAKIGIATSNNVSYSKCHSSSSSGGQKESLVVKFPNWGKATANEKVLSGTEKDSVRTDNINNKRLIVRLPNLVRNLACTTSGGPMVDLTASNKGLSASLSERHDVTVWKSKMLTGSQRGSILHANKGTGKFEAGSGDDKERLFPVIPVDYAVCGSIEFEHEAKGTDGKKSSSLATFTTPVDAFVASIGDSRNDTGINLLASVAAKESSVDEEHNIDTPTERGITSVLVRPAEVDDELESSTEADPLILDQKHVMGRLSDKDDNEIPGGSGIDCKTLTSQSVISEPKVLRGEEFTESSSLDTSTLIETDKYCVKTLKRRVVAEESREGLPTMETCTAKEKEVDVCATCIQDENQVIKEDMKFQGTDDNISNTDKEVEQRTDEVKDIAQKSSIDAAPSATLVGSPSAVNVQRAAELASQFSNEMVQEVEQVEQYVKPLQQEKLSTAFVADNAITDEIDQNTNFERPYNELELGKDIVTRTESGNMVGEQPIHILDEPGKINKMEMDIDTMQNEQSVFKRAIDMVTGETSPSKTLELEETGKKLNDVQIVGGDCSSRFLFDLNEGITLDESPPDNTAPLTAMEIVSPLPLASASVPTPLTAMEIVSPLPLASVSVPISSGLAAPVAIVAAAKGPFIPPSDSFPRKAELRWKGSAATSAFRPAEPRHILERPQISSDKSVPNSSGDVNRPQRLEIDLNTVDEKMLEDMEAGSLQRSDLDVQNSAVTSSSQALAPFAHGILSIPNTCQTVRLELDLNQADGSRENIAPLARGFDLNDGLSVEDVTANESASASSDNNFVLSRLPSFLGMRMDQEVGRAWFSPDQFLSPSPTLSVVRAEPSYPVVAAASSDSLLRGGLIHSSGISYATSTPANIFYPDSTPRSSLPASSISFVNSRPQYLDSSASTLNPAMFPQLPSSETTSYGRPCLMAVADISVIERSITSPGLNLDLNYCPGSVDMDARDERIVTRQVRGFGQLSFQHQGTAALGASKRKEPEGGFDPF